MTRELFFSQQTALGHPQPVGNICVFTGQEQTGVVVTYERLMLINRSAWHCMNEFLYLDIYFKASCLEICLLCNR